MGSGVTGNTADSGSVIQGSIPCSPAMADVDSILVGKRIELISMVDDPDPIPSGAQGVVQRVSI